MTQHTSSQHGSAGQSNPHVKPQHVHTQSHMSHFKHERTLVVIKPDGVQRSLVGEVISRYERTGLKLVGLKFLRPTADMIRVHYTIDPEWLRKIGEKAINSAIEKGQPIPEGAPEEIGETVLGSLTEYFSAGPVVAMVWEGAHAVAIVRKITGGTEPLCSDVGTIRGDFVIDSYQMAGADGRSIRNVVHASGTPSEAEQEIKHWFKKEELMEYVTAQEEILYSRI
jgi:nucleoside-diphosphate kinase